MGEKLYVCGGRKRSSLCVILIFHRSVEVRTLDQQPRDAFAFMLGNAVSAEGHGAILAIKFLAVENFVPAFTAFDGSIDQLKHKPLRSEMRQTSLISKLGRSHLRLSTVILL